tara:strand:- start:769 stop:1302 length:534 start_codon:yes stop_codon:yes gene_type:complete
MHNKIPPIFTFISEFKKEEILKLNKNVAIIFRNYIKLPNKRMILEIKKFCKKEGRKIFLANNFKLAVDTNLDGVYIPSFNKSLNLRKFNYRKNFAILGSAHNMKEIRIKEKQGVEAIFISPLFRNKNYKKNLGIVKFNILSRLTNKKIIALGGINKNNINKLKITNAYGFSGISYFN